jgi:hypothetical protein
MAFRALTIAVLVVVTRTASAEPVPRWDLGLVFAGGAEQIGDRTFAQIGVSTWLGRRVTPNVSVTARGELLTTNADASDGTVIIGETMRGFVGIDWRVLATDKAFMPQLFVDAGVGRELTAWDRGTVGRELVFVGIESRQGFDIPQDGAIHGVSRMGMPMGLRLQLAPAIDSLTIARACSQCGTPPPAHTDLAILFYYGLEFGR